MLLLAAAAAQWRDMPQVQGALRGVGVVAAGLVISTAIKLAPALRSHRLGLPLAVTGTTLTVLAIAVLRLPLAPVVLGLGLGGLVLVWWRAQP